MKKKFQENHINVGVSLPLVTRGTDDIYSHSKINSRESFQHWTLDDGEKQIVMKAEISVVSDIFSDFDYEIENVVQLDDGEDLDFL